MESIRSVIASLRQGEYLASVDIQNAYLRVHIYPPQHFRGFAVASKTSILLYCSSAILFSQSVHKGLSTPAGPAQETGHSTHRLSTVDNLLLKDSSLSQLSEKVSQDNSTDPGFWLSDQFFKICSATLPSPGILGSGPGHSPG